VQVRIILGRATTLKGLDHLTRLLRAGRSETAPFVSLDRGLETAASAIRLRRNRPRCVTRG